MKSLIAAATMALTMLEPVAAAGFAFAQGGAELKIARAGSQPSSSGPANYFTGSVRVEEIRPGDVIWIPPGVKHWHGAAPTTGMTHIAIQENQDGKAVDWLEKVSDAQYEGRP